MANNSSYKDSNGNLVEVELDANGNIPVSSVGQGDGDTFIAGTSEGTPIIGVYESTPTTVTDGDMGVVGMTTKRAMKTALETPNGDSAMDDSANAVKVVLASAIAGEDLTNDVLKTEEQFSITYQAAAAANVVVKASGGYLKGIMIGKDVASSVVEVSDHASDGDGDVRVYLEGSTLMTATGGYVPINALFPDGISADLTNQTNVSFIWR